MKRELDSNRWCRVSGSRERGLLPYVLSERKEEPGQTFAGEKKQIESEGCATRGGEKPDQFIY